jgi:HEPN domain-containing protein
MLNIQKQIEYWKKGALEDFETADILILKNKFRHGLFFCHLAVEKMLKAHYVKTLKDIAPITHNLIFLLSKTDLELSEEYRNILPVLMKYQLEGRYPDYNPLIPSKEIIIEYLKKTKGLVEWLEKKL